MAISLIISSICIAFAQFQKKKNKVLEKHNANTIGTITESNCTTTKTYKNNHNSSFRRSYKTKTTCKISIRYEIGDNVYNKNFTVNKKYNIDDIIKVFYDSNNPSDASVQKPNKLIINICYAIALILPLLAIINYFVLRPPIKYQVAQENDLLGD